MMSALNNRLTNLDLSYTIPYSEFKKYTPNFIGTPLEVDTATNKVTLSAEIDNYGWLFAMATKTNEDKGKPSSQQIQLGLNSTNGIVPSWKLEISQPF